MCNIAFQLVFQQCYETSSTVHRTFYRNISFVICGAFILGEGAKGGTAQETVFRFRNSGG